jgi:hypothetical protein
MNASEKKPASSFDENDEAVRITEQGRSRAAMFYQLLAVLLIAGFIAYLLMQMLPISKSTENHAQADSALDMKGSDVLSESSAGIAASKASSMTDRKRVMGVSQMQHDRSDLSHYVAKGEAPPMKEVIERLHDAGIHEGLGAFSPPGTSPPLIGLAVPDDYALPEGYVRHFQATDDGQRIEPILMYSPDFEFFDSAGQPISIPADRVVPANRAPPGLVIRPIKIPAPRGP